MLRSTWRAAAACLLSAGLSLAGCTSSQEPAYYVLGPGAANDARAPTRPSPALIGLRELALPLYARRAQIASVGPDGAISLSDDHRWADDPPRAVSRVVARTLTVLTSWSVIIEPWPVGLEPDVRVDIEVDYFAGTLGGELRLSGQYRIIRKNGPSPVTKTFSVTERSADESYAALVDSHTRALEALARRISLELLENR